MINFNEYLIFKRPSIIKLKFKMIELVNIMPLLNCIAGDDYSVGKINLIIFLLS